MKTNADLTFARAHELFSFEPSTGNLIRKIQRGPGKVGDIAGSAHSAGYRAVMADGVNYMVHRVIWLMLNGVWPVDLIDHRNGGRSDNRLDNLRDVTPTVNLQNQRGAKPSNSTGLLGVTPRGSKFQAQISHAGKNNWLGNFNTPELAHSAYLTAKRQLHTGCTT